MRTLLIAWLVLVTGTIAAQISFTESESTVTREFRNGSAITCMDMNGDCLDDLVRLNKGRTLHVDLQYGDEKFFAAHQETVSPNPEWTLIAGDINQDGLPDIVTSGVIDHVKVFTATPFLHSYQRTTIADTYYFAQGSNVADVNEDGFQDIFVCNDNGLNRLYINDGMGDFDRNDTVINFSTTPASDNSGNYGSIWTDFDMDGDLDLYISKCRAGVFELTDPRRINVLYVNTDTGYIEMADSFGLAIPAQSWSSDFADIDNDGDLDLVVINHDYASQLFENTGNGNYMDITEDAGIVITGNTIQSVFRDFDNDGLVDLLVSGSQAKLYRNQGNNTFELVAAPFGGETISSFTIGDFNSDGFPDVYATYNTLYNIPSTSKDDKIWINTANDNNYLRIKAVTLDSTVASIGTKFLLYTDSTIQVREVRAGESYGISTSQIKNFGLGSLSAVDSLMVIWPNGDTNVHLNPTLNTTLSASPNGCLNTVVTLDQGPFVQCGSDTFTLNGPAGYATYLWSNGSNTQSIQVTAPGLYHVNLMDSAGCTSITNPITVRPCLWPTEVVYVDSSASGANTGEDWQNAFTDLQVALDVADSFYLNIEQIWVAQGTYYPTSSIDRNASFTLVDSIDIYGGFLGNEPDTSGRDYMLYPTVLSGNIGVDSDSTDNCYHVLICPDSIADIHLDGFTIQGGQANGLMANQTRGAAIYSKGKLSLYNVKLRSCYSTGEGSYIFNTGTNAQLYLLNTQIQGNISVGVVNADGASLIIQGTNQLDK